MKGEGPHTVAEPVLVGVLGGEALEQGLQRPRLHRRALQPAQHLHRRLEEERGEDLVLRHAPLEGGGKYVQNNTSTDMPVHACYCFSARKLLMQYWIPEGVVDGL